MHDISTLDKRGIPGCTIVSEAFKPAAAAQSKSLGFEPAIIWLPHPIQNRTPEELSALADDVIVQVLEKICQGSD